MRILAVGDIHGCYRSLLELAQFVPFAEDDLIVTLGDYVDRGPDSRRVVDWVLNRTIDGKCVPLRGNHEIMFMAALNDLMPMGQWLQYGGADCLNSYSRGRPGSSEDVPQFHVDFLSNRLRDYYETETHIFVHAAVDPGLPMSEQSERELFWERFDYQQPHLSGKTIVCGHTSQKSGRPWNRGHAVCIDTWAYGKGF